MKQPHNLMAILLKMAKADQKVEPHEMQFLKDVSNQLGMSETDWKELTNQFEDHELQIPQTEKERAIYLYHLLFLMKIDGEVSIEEEKLCHEIGLRLGFRPELTRRLIEIIKNHIGKAVPVDLMLNAIRQYHN